MDKLLAAAEAEFGRRGFSEARLEDIAAHAGISRPSLLYHFNSKDALYEAVVHAAFARLASAVGAALGGEGSFGARIDALVAGYQAFLDANPNVARLILREVVDGRGPGRALMVREAIPVLQLVERTAKREGKGALREGAPVREALLQLGFTAMIRASVEELREPLFGKRDHTRELARTLLLKE